jgi:hypothetical protein
LNLKNVSPKEGVGGSIPSGAATFLNLNQWTYCLHLVNFSFRSLPGISDKTERPAKQKLTFLGSNREGNALYTTEGTLRRNQF